VYLNLKNVAGQTISTAEFNNNVTFEDYSTHSFEMPLPSNSINKNDIVNGSLVIQIRPNGHDTWKFTPSLKMKFSDGTEIVQNNFTLISLSQDNNQISLAF